MSARRPSHNDQDDEGARVSHSIDELPALVARLYQVVEELEALFPGRHFTPDGHLVGSLGEVWAQYLYELELHPASHAVHDGLAPCGRQVQVKATQGNDYVDIGSEPEHLVVLRLLRDQPPEEVYNGPGALAWQSCNKPQKSGERSIALGTLRKLMLQVEPELRIASRAS